MRFDYDPETDSLYIKLFDRPGVEASEVEPGIVFDYDEEGELIGIDIEHASHIAGFLAMLTNSGRQPIIPVAVA